MEHTDNYHRSSPQVHLLGNPPDSIPGSEAEYDPGNVGGALASAPVSRQQFAHHTFMLIKKAGATGVLSVKIQVSPYSPDRQDFDPTSHWVDLVTLTAAAPIATFQNAVLPYVRALRSVEAGVVEAKVVVCSSNHRG